MAELIIKSGPNTGQRFQFDSQVFIGRSRERLVDQDDYLLLEDREISRQHLRIYREQRAYYVQDLHSTNGSLLQGKPLQPGIAYPLQNGDILQLGASHLQFQAGQPGFQMPREPVHPTSLDMDLAAARSRASASVHLLSEDDAESPDVSVMIDATRFLQQIQTGPAVTASDTDLLKRLQVMVKVSLALGAEHDLDAMLGKITDFVFELFPGAERAFIIACDKDCRDFQPLILRYREGRESDQEGEIALSRSITREVLKKRHALLLQDALGDRHYGAQESVVNLAIRSVMCAPLLYQDEVLGLIQVDTTSRAHSFNQDDLQVLTAIATQMAISMKNTRLYEEIEKLFEGFVRASVQAIEARDPGTAGHSFRVAEYTENLAIAVDRSQAPGLRDALFSREQLQELRFAALLHDFGKVGVREHVLTKAKRLYPAEVRLLRQRFRYARACLERQVYRELVEQRDHEAADPAVFRRLREQKEAELAQRIDQLNEFFNTILLANEPETDIRAAGLPLEQIAQYRFIDTYDEAMGLLSPFELATLNEARGSLNPEERKEIQSHVSHTFDFLRLIPWTGQFANVPDIAHAHHEKLDGSGYPLGLDAEAIPLQSRIMTIADIYDALTAGDRPYRDGINSEQALGIIESEVKAGKLDAQLFRVFVEAGAYRLKSG